MERIMSILNLGFQSIGLMRKQVEDRLESTISKCNNKKQLRAAAQKEPELVDAVLDSMSPVKIVITDVIRRLNLKGKQFEVYSAASMQAIEEIWDSLHSIDTSLKFGDKYIPEKLPIFSPFIEEFPRPLLPTAALLILYQKVW